MSNKMYFGTQVLPTELPQSRIRPAMPQHPGITGTCNPENRQKGMGNISIQNLQWATTLARQSNSLCKAVIYTQEAQKSPAEQGLQL